MGLLGVRVEGAFGVASLRRWLLGEEGSGGVGGGLLRLIEEGGRLLLSRLRLIPAKEAAGLLL